MSCWQPGHGMVVTRGVTDPLRHPGEEMEPDLTSLSSLSMEGEGTLDLGLPGREHSEPASKESSWFNMSSSLTHLWQTLCWQGRISGWVKSSLQIGQISSLSMFLIGTPFMLLRRISADIPGEKTLCERLKNT